MKKLVLTLMICSFFAATSVFGQQPWSGSNLAGNSYRVGNVGIGESSPTALLHIKAVSQTGVDLFGNPFSYTPTGLRLQLDGSPNNHD